MLTGLPISPGEPLSPITVLAGDHSTMPLFELSPSFSIWLPIADSSTYYHKFTHVKTVNCQPCNDLETLGFEIQTHIRRLPALLQI